MYLVSTECGASLGYFGHGGAGRSTVSRAKYSKYPSRPGMQMTMRGEAERVASEVNGKKEMIYSAGVLAGLGVRVYLIGRYVLYSALRATVDTMVFEFPLPHQGAPCLGSPGFL
jgi:hypothetical protein